MTVTKADCFHIVEVIVGVAEGFAGWAEHIRQRTGIKIILICPPGAAAEVCGPLKHSELRVGEAANAPTLVSDRFWIFSCVFIRVSHARKICGPVGSRSGASNTDYFQWQAQIRDIVDDLS